MRLSFLLEVLVDPWRAVWLRRALALFTISLSATSWRLWTPQTVFPRVPLVSAARWVPAGAEWVLAALAVGGFAVAAMAKRDGAWRAALRIAAGALVGLMLIDQHRLQPWAYQAVLVALALANCPAPRSFALVRLLTVSIYFYSGLSKLDYEFLHSLGQQFLLELLKTFGTNLDAWSTTARLLAAALFPLAEIVIAIGFCFRRSWRAAIVGSLLLHGGLLVILGPWGLHHSWAVLIWNVYFMVQNVLLFAQPAAAEALAAPGEAAETSSNISPVRLTGVSARATQAVLLAAMLLPLLEPLGWFDAWPSWSLYAPSSERVTLLVHSSALGQLGGLARFCETDPDDQWVRMRLDRWSLEALAVPIYPQNRFQIGVADAVAAAQQLGHRVRAIELGRSDRFTGERRQRILSGQTEIAAAAGKFLLNGRPDRRFALRPAATPSPGPDD